ncbi:MAG: DUF3536 domain-containing protein [Chloroflexota bacterium]
MNKYVCIHGHFYQPPRENAWLEDVEVQDSAYPYHDWNERITQECYLPNAASRLKEGDVITNIQNNYTKISFNFGPTVLSWMEREMPDAYEAIISSDKASMENFGGHGTALAQCYNHMIMPLANDRDRKTQVIWGIEDFKYRFGRMPEGMWLPETAVNTPTLETLAEFGIKFTVLSPFQAKAVRKIGTEKWFSVEGGHVDPRRPYLYKLPSGRSIALFFYDGNISQEVGYGEMLSDGKVFAETLLGAFDKNNKNPQIVHIATDGETYGHHKENADMALAYCIHHIENSDYAQMTIYGQYLDIAPPDHEAQILENTAWSCSHGVGRWMDDCGCNSGMHGDWKQTWRKPLRESLDWLRDELIPFYEEHMKPFGSEPWLVRDNYIKLILNREQDNEDKFFKENFKKELSIEDRIEILKLLELQRHAMLMYTSCGWFFDEISGLETSQVLQYAARSIQLAYNVAGIDLETEFLKRLESIPSNIPEFGNGAYVYNNFIKPTMLDLERVAVHYTLSSLFNDQPKELDVYHYRAESSEYQTYTMGAHKLAIGKVTISSRVTKNYDEFLFAAMHLGGTIMHCSVNKNGNSDAEFEELAKEVRTPFLITDVAGTIRMIDKKFGGKSYGLLHLFRDEQRRVVNKILDSTYEDIEFHFREVFRSNYYTLRSIQNLHIPIPKALFTPGEFIITADLVKELEVEETNTERLRNLIGEFKNLGLTPDRPLLNLKSGIKINDIMGKFVADTDNIGYMQSIIDLIENLKALAVQPDFWKAQNEFVKLSETDLNKYEEKAQAGDEAAGKWVETFKKLGQYLKVRI